jgi:chemotaxis protein histidine kinase CheA
MVTTITPTTGTPEPQAPAGEMPASFEEFLEKQDEGIKALYTSHSEALLNTVKATRDERDALKKQIKELAKGQAEGSEARRQLEEMGAQLEKTERRAAFLEDAMKPEIQCKNARAAWLLADAEGLFDKKGNPDWAAIKREAPELFGAPVANANAGQGTQTPPDPHQNMNAFIRKAAGRT